MQKIKKFIPIGLSLTPMLVFAATDIPAVIDTIMRVLNVVIPLIIAIAVVVFLVGVVKYITAGGDEEKRKEARNVMIYGIIGLFVMVAVWGLVNLLVNTFNLQTSAPPPPELPR
jgi:heme/copper-type cytochrome/quinol oxidase subunit 2